MMNPAPMPKKMHPPPGSFVQYASIHAALYIFSAIFVLLRLLDRQRRKMFRMTDILTICAFVIWTADIAMVITLGNLAYTQRKGLSAQASILGMAVTTAHYTVTPLARLSVAFLLLELEPPKLHRRLIVVYIVVLTLFMIVNSTLAIFSCRIFDGFHWDVFHANSLPMPTNSSTDHRCVAQHSSLLLHTIGGIVAVVILFSLALPFVFRLKADRSTKLSLTFFFMLGILNIVTTAMEAKNDVQAITASDQSQSSLTRSLEDVIIENYWAAADSAFALSIASILPLRALLIRFFSDLLHMMSTHPRRPSDEPGAEASTCQPESITLSRFAHEQIQMPKTDDHSILDFEPHEQGDGQKDYVATTSFQVRRSAGEEELVAIEIHPSDKSKNMTQLF